MNVLFVDGCVREDSRTRRLCEAYMQAHWNKEDITVRERDVCREAILPLDRERLKARDRDTLAGDFSSEEYRYAKEFAEADEILIGAPYWDCSFPALLKLYLERICVNGVAFRYGEDGRPVKMCRAGKLIYITTSGGYLPESNSLERYWRELCDLFVIPELRVYKAEGLDIWGNDPEQILQDAIGELSAAPAETAK